MDKAQDILKTAIEHEVHAEVFYTKAAELTEDDEARMVFLELSGLEDDHSRRLVQRFESSPLSAHVDLQTFLDETEEAMKHLLTVEETELIRNGGMRSVLEFALEREQEARDNYEALAKSLEDGDDSEFCRQMAKEEQRHVELINQLLRSLEMDPEERPDL